MTTKLIDDSAFLTESEAAALLRVNRTTLRAMALAGKAPVEPVYVTPRKRIYPRRKLELLAGKGD